MVLMRQCLNRFALAGFIAFVAPLSHAGVQCRDFFASEPARAAGLNAKDRLAQARTEILRMKEGRVLYSQLVMPAEGRPMLLLMPGANRAFTLQDRGIKELVERGFGVATCNLSVQPFSLLSLKSGERPAFRDTDPQLQDFAAEVQFVAENLKAAHGLANVIPVSLSYSGAISPFLKGFPFVVETAPMTSTHAARPELGRYYETLKAGTVFNPIFGPSLMRSALDTAYRQTWAPQVEMIIEQFSLSRERTNDMIEGYVSMSRATEAFDWKDLRLSKNTRRAFIVGTKEQSSLLRHQIETFERVRAERADSLLFVIEGAEHLIPALQPISYAAVFEFLASPAAKEASGVAFVAAESGKIEFKSAADAKKLIDKLL